MKVPVVVGVPEMVIIWSNQAAVTPGGKPTLIGSIPVAPVVSIVIGVKGEFTDSVGFDEGESAVLGVQGFT